MSGQHFFPRQTLRLGAIAAASLTQLLTLLLYGVSPLDGASFGVAGAVLGVVADGLVDAFCRRADVLHGRR